MNTTLFTLFILFFSAYSVFGQAKKHSQIELKQGVNAIVPYDYITDVAFVDSLNGCIIGSRGMIQHTKDGGASWHVQKSPFNSLLRQVHFVNKNNGWILGEQNILLKTKNGGTLWKDISPKEYVHIYTCYFLNPEQGWISTEKGLHETRDGGITWKLIFENKDGYFAQMLFTDPFHGFMLNQTGLLKTKDGGLSWNFVEIATSQGASLTHVSFCDSLHGMLVANYPDLNLFTNDGGLTWVKKRGMFDQAEYEEDYETYPAFYLHPNHVLIGNANALYESYDYGETWQMKMNLQDYSFGQIKFTNAQIGFLFAGMDLFKTTDAGSRWECIRFNEMHTLNDVFFVNSQRGWSVGEHGRILHTTDAGSTWEMQFSNVRASLNHVFFIDELKGWITGTNGLVLHTSDGGKTWANQTLVLDLKLDEEAKAFFEKQSFQIGNCMTHQIIRLQMLDALNGWIVSRIKTCLGHDFVGFFNTIDGGNTWAYHELSPDLKLTDACFVNKDTVFAVLGQSLISSVNQGKTWGPMGLGNCKYVIKNVCQVNDSLLHVVTTHSLFVFNMYSQVSMLFTLPRENFHLSAAKMIGFVDEKLGFYMANNQLYKLSGGVIICHTPLFMSETFKNRIQSLFVLSSNELWVVGQNGLIAKLIL